ncbi:hypothetical protein QW131_04225 [Roseibium salinum]|nr:hypothetical protein [Roseibium salinum]
MPFVRQFANTDRAWFDGERWSALKAWLVRFETSDRFRAVMPKLEKNGMRATSPSCFLPPQARINRPGGPFTGWECRLPAPASGYRVVFVPTLRNRNLTVRRL